jgi:UDP-glucose 4-epimerase
MEGRRAGGPDALTADNSAILSTFNWKPARHDLNQIVTDALMW